MNRLRDFRITRVPFLVVQINSLVAIQRLLIVMLNERFHIDFRAAFCQRRTISLWPLRMNGEML